MGPYPRNIISLAFNTVRIVILYGLLIGFSSFPLQGAEIRNPDQCVSNYDKNHNYFPDQVSIDHAEGFQVTYHHNYKHVKVAVPWKKGNETYQYILVQCGTPAPKGYDDAQLVMIPSKTMIVLSTTYLAYVEQLDLLDRLIGVDNVEHVNSPQIVKLIEQKKIGEVGQNIDLNLERTTQLNPDIVMTYGTGNPYQDNFAQLMSFGIGVGVFTEYMEASLLGSAEWIKFMALFFNREAQASAVFGEIATQYQAVAKLAQNVKKRPTVFTGSSFEGIWYMPGGRSFMVSLLRDAGARYLWSDDLSHESLRLDFEAVLEKAAHADYWLNSGKWKTLRDGLAEDSRYQFFSAFQQKKVFNNNALINQNGGNDYWETGVANPQLVLSDLVKIFHPELLPEHQLIWYHRLQ